jgi:hypothetical protein
MADNSLLLDQQHLDIEKEWLREFHGYNEAYRYIEIFSKDDFR